jgi:uncharacterized protein with NAD-binding domain and iron-sulfur cluster
MRTQSIRPRIAEHSALISESVHARCVCLHHVPRSPGASQYTTSAHSVQATQVLAVTLQLPQVQLFEHVRVSVRGPQAPGQRSDIIPVAFGAHSP